MTVYEGLFSKITGLGFNVERIAILACSAKRYYADPNIPSFTDTWSVSAWDIRGQGSLNQFTRPVVFPPRYVTGVGFNDDNYGLDRDLDTLFPDLDAVLIGTFPDGTFVQEYTATEITPPPGYVIEVTVDHSYTGLPVIAGLNTKTGLVSGFANQPFVGGFRAGFPGFRSNEALYHSGAAYLGAGMSVTWGTYAPYSTYSGAEVGRKLSALLCSGTATGSYQYGTGTITPTVGTSSGEIYFDDTHASTILRATRDLGSEWIDTYTGGYP